MPYAASRTSACRKRYSTSPRSRPGPRRWITSRRSSSDSHRVTPAPPSNALTPLGQNAWPNTLAARSTRRASASSASMRACTIASTVSGRSAPWPAATARTCSSR
ncbi:hypothetical protein BE15_18630 [Sorangium cellulosum]|uniref:Uncharacterized protein n=1 Tax=Sorangium cellulosum TaxID=56 RepID=A0A150QA69_SORCE|nr:hypothetical protein BE15_18630 [Sorangium cellulosum]